MASAVGRCSRPATTWRIRRRDDDDASAASTSVAPEPAPTPLADAMRVARKAAGSAALHPLLVEPPAVCTSALSSVALGEVLQRRDGLPRLSATLRQTSSDPLRVCYLGGSVTEQRSGYRPRVTRWLEAVGAPARVRVEEVPAFCGSALQQSKASVHLSFLSARAIAHHTARALYLEALYT